MRFFFLFGYSINLEMEFLQLGLVTLMVRFCRCGHKELDSGQGLAGFAVVWLESQLELAAIIFHSFWNFGC